MISTWNTRRSHANPPRMQDQLGWVDNRPPGGALEIVHVTPEGARDWTGTLYLLYQTLVCPSLITVSTYRIQKKIQNKTTTVVVFIVSHTYSPESHLYIQKLYIYIYRSERRTYSDEPLLVCWLSRMRKSLSPSYAPTQIENPC